MATEAIGSTQFSIGRVLGDSIGIYARNFVGFTALALVIGVLNLLWLMFYLAPAQAGAALGQFNLGAIGIGALIGMLTHSLTQATIIYGTFQDLRGSRASIGDCISRGFGLLVPVIVGSILFTLGVALGTLLLIIPGAILALMWWVYIPVLVVEGKSVSEGFSRSQELTRGHRWAILGLGIIVLVLSYAVHALINVASGVAVASSPDVTVSTLPAILSYVGTSLIAAFNAVLVAVGYYYLRVEKDGVDVNQIASVFD